MQIGTYYYTKGESGAILNDILRKVAADKAMGPDRISDRWMRRKRNAMPYMALLEEHFNEKT